ncbi:MAG: hypothetical protein GY944_06465 [bacterium]|nr:hypothetical protein [bacterium]
MADRKLIERPIETGDAGRTVQLAAALLIGLVLGAVIGRTTAPTTDTPSDATTANREDSSPGPGIGVIANLIDQAEEFVDSEHVDRLSTVGEIISNASVSDILDWSRAPEDVSRRIINEMSDDELISTITSITKLQPEDLNEYSDLRDYANRLSHIAMSGVITPEISAEFDGVEVDVTFATDASSSHGAEDPSSVFTGDTRKIYAVIPNVGDQHNDVMVHWYRVDQPRNLLFDQYRVSPDNDYSYVWLKSPNGQWDQGEYRVEFFSADELLVPIASGTYSVAEE